MGILGFAAVKQHLLTGPHCPPAARTPRRSAAGDNVDLLSPDVVMQDMSQFVMLSPFGARTFRDVRRQWTRKLCALFDRGGPRVLVLCFDAAPRVTRAKGITARARAAAGERARKRTACPPPADEPIGDHTPVPTDWNAGCLFGHFRRRVAAWVGEWAPQAVAPATPRDALLLFMGSDGVLSARSWVAGGAAGEVRSSSPAVSGEADTAMFAVVRSHLQQGDTVVVNSIDADSVCIALLWAEATPLVGEVFVTSVCKPPKDTAPSRKRSTRRFQEYLRIGALAHVCRRRWGDTHGPHFFVLLCLLSGSDFTQKLRGVSGSFIVSKGVHGFKRRVVSRGFDAGNLPLCVEIARTAETVYAAKTTKNPSRRDSAAFSTRADVGVLARNARWTFAYWAAAATTGDEPDPFAPGTGFEMQQGGVYRC